MHLIAGHLRASHWPDVLRLCHPKVEPGSEEALRLAKDWETLWAHADVLGVVVEDFGAAGHPVRGLMVTTFITPEAYQSAIASPMPHLLRRVIAAAREDEPVFVRPATAHGGLVLLVCYVGWEGDDYLSEAAATLRGVVTNA